MSSLEDEFADEVITLARNVLGLQAKRLDGFALQILGPDGKPATMNLRNIHAQAQLLYGEERAAWLSEFMLEVLTKERSAGWHATAPSLLPAVRPTKWAGVTLPVAKAVKPAADSALSSIPFCKPLAPFVKVVCAVDSERTMAFATEEDLAAWDVSGEAALATAITNLAARPCEIHRNGPTATIDGPDGYASSWLAVPAVLSRAAAAVGNNVVAIALGRDELVLVDTEHPTATAQILGLALDQYQNATRQLSPVPYLVSETGIEPWVPPRDHPAGPAVDKANHLLAVVEYGQQKARLDAAADEAAYVAERQLRRRPDGTLQAWAAWVRQVGNGLLPATDMLMLVDNDDSSADFAVTWTDALRLAGHALHQEPEYDPPRWRYRGWPDEGTMEALRSTAA